MALLSVEHLTKHFRLDRSVGAALMGRPAGWIKPVEDLSFEIAPGEILGIVGESGGKSTTCNLIYKLLEPTSGCIRFDGEDVTNLSVAARGEGRVRDKQIGNLFADSSLAWE